MTTPPSPSKALQLGQWFKLICGASYQDVSQVRNLALVYSLAGADCVDVAADLAVVQAAVNGIRAARSIAGGPSPWLMVSFNDGQDPHFRKAWFDPQTCPADCPRPCEQLCPASAIPAADTKAFRSGVITERCYGCGRCLPVCPEGLIEEHSFKVAAGTIAPDLLPYIDAIEIHTQVGRQDDFRHLWQQLKDYIPHLKLVAVSCPDPEPKSDDLVSYLRQLYQHMDPKPQLLLWQTDGRPMSGDIGKGTTLATVRLAQKVLNARLPGYVQLAGGTNRYTVEKLRSLNLLQTSCHRGHSNHQQHSIHGIAYGSYARRLVSLPDGPIEHQLEQLWQQVNIARELVAQIKPALDSHPAASQFFNCHSLREHTSSPLVPP